MHIYLFCNIVVYFVIVAEHTKDRQTTETAESILIQYNAINGF